MLRMVLNLNYSEGKINKARKSIYYVVMIEFSKKNSKDIIQFKFIPNIILVKKSTISVLKIYWEIYIFKNNSDFLFGILPDTQMEQ